MELFLSFRSKNAQSLALFRFTSVFVVLVSVQLSYSSNDGNFMPLNRENNLFSLEEVNTEILSSAMKSYDRADEKNGTDLTPAIIVSSCQAFIDAYANVVASFAKCSIMYARPLRFCHHCVAEYVTANTYSSVILKDVGIVDTEGTSCWQSISNSDRVQIIIKTVQFIDNLWSECDCEHCFEYARMVNDTVEYKLNNDTMTFFSKANKTWDCFRNATEFRVESARGNNVSTCLRCLDQYEDLNAFYEVLQDKYDRQTCMDIVDMMNSTRSAWSNAYRCNQRPHNLLPVFVLSGFFCLLPIVFYVSNKIHGTKVQNRLMKQRRLKDATDGRLSNVSNRSDPQSSHSSN